MRSSLASLADALDIGPLVFAPAVAAIVFVYLRWDARAEPPTARDHQIGLKAVIATLVLVGVYELGTGARQLLHLILTFEQAGPRAKAALPAIVVGAGVVVTSVLVLLPRTNVQSHPRVRGAIAGLISAFAGVALVEHLVGLLEAILTWPSWNVVAAWLSGTLTSAVSFTAGLYLLAWESGVDVPPPAGMLGRARASLEPRR